MVVCNIPTIAILGGVAVKALDDYNKQQPTYKQLSRLVVRENPFIKNSSKKIIRHEVTRDEPVV